jgi:hypothetical protein
LSRDPPRSVKIREGSRLVASPARLLRSGPASRKH